MLPRIVAAALLLSLALGFPLTAHAGECQAVLVFFESSRDILDIINVDTSQSLHLLFIRNDGTFAGDASISINGWGRVRLTAAQVYDRPWTPKITDSYLWIKSDYGRLFSVTVTQSNITPQTLRVMRTTREPACMTVAP